ncbi:tetraspanin family protein [Onchocerca flexuosa]|uniref:Tetraspanin family protein n=2 Tax=Onchocerca flexuosa TaxID=387005 RepID=A0A238BWD5_9BILA|nr:tetraspanin family protein [Onchocerca flexuosa]
MPSVEYGRFGLQPTAINHNRSKHLLNEPKKRKPRQEICAPLKWLCFIANFLVFLIGVTCLALGVYLCIKDPRPIAEWADVFLNPAIVLTIIGLAICTVSLMGSLGALRDNIALLKTFALSVFFCYIVIVTLTFLLFILFYSDTTEGLSAHSILIYSVKNYHTNRNLADFVDYIQEQLECCGVSSSSQGYRDWQLSDQFNCNPTNPYPEKCGVPFSCCKRSVVSEAAAGSTNPLLPAMRSLQCWQNAQTKRPQELEADLHTRGCLQPLRILFESHAIHVGAAVAIIIIPVCISVCLSNILAKQIDHQRYLLEREARRCERRRRHNERIRLRDPYTTAIATTAGEPKRSTGAPRHNTGQKSDDSVTAIDLGLESVKVTEPPRSSVAVQPEKKLPVLNLAKFPQSPPPVPPHEPSPQNGEIRRHRKHCRPTSNSPSKHIVQTSSSAINQHQRISNGTSTAAPPNKQKQRRRSVTIASAPKTTTENRTQQWVLEQSDLVSYEPVV